MGKVFERNYLGKGMEIEVNAEEERGWLETKLTFRSARRLHNRTFCDLRRQLRGSMTIKSASMVFYRS